MFTHQGVLHCRWIIAAASSGEVFGYGEPVPDSKPSLVPGRYIARMIPDDPDDAFKVNTYGDLEVAFFLETDIPGEWEAQWSLEPAGSTDHMTGTITIQLFGIVLPQNEE